METISYLDVDDVLEIFEALIGPAKDQLRSYALLESAVLAPQQSAFGRDAYPTIVLKAWSYLRGLAQNHAFVDGNKRIAWTAMRTFLLVNGFEISAPTSVAEELVVRVAAGQPCKAEFLQFIKRYGSRTEDIRQAGGGQETA